MPWVGHDPLTVCRLDAVPIISRAVGDLVAEQTQNTVNFKDRDPPRELQKQMSSFYLFKNAVSRPGCVTSHRVTEEQVVVAYFRVLYQNLFGEAEENHKKS